MGRYLQLADQALARHENLAIADGVPGSGRPTTVLIRSTCDLSDQSDRRLEDASDLDERAAIVQHDGGIPRQWAEGYAYLQTMPVPEGVPLQRWRRFVDNVGQFLDGWARRAAALGWSAEDLFGLDRTRPCERVDLAGLVWMLPPGAEIIALTADTAAIRLETGSVQSYRRDPGRRGIAAWHLAEDAAAKR